MASSFSSGVRLDVSMFVSNCPVVITSGAPPAVTRVASSRVKSVTVTDDNSSATVVSDAPGASDCISSAISSKIEGLESVESIAETASFEIAANDEVSVTGLDGANIVGPTLRAAVSSTFISISYSTTPSSLMSVTVTMESCGSTPSSSSVFLIKF